MRLHPGGQGAEGPAEGQVEQHREARRGRVASRGGEGAGRPRRRRGCSRRWSGAPRCCRSGSSGKTRRLRSRPARIRRAPRLRILPEHGQRAGLLARFGQRQAEADEEEKDRRGHRHRDVDHVVARPSHDAVLPPPARVVQHHEDECCAAERVEEDEPHVVRPRRAAVGRVAPRVRRAGVDRGCADRRAHALVVTSPRQLTSGGSARGLC